MRGAVVASQSKVSVLPSITSVSLLVSTVAVSHTWLLRTPNVASRTEELNYKFYLILINLKLNSDM